MHSQPLAREEAGQEAGQDIRPLQVIVKMQSYILQPGQSYEGAFHIREPRLKI